MITKNEGLVEIIQKMKCKNVLHWIYKKIEYCLCPPDSRYDLGKASSPTLNLKLFGSNQSPLILPKMWTRISYNYYIMLFSKILTYSLNAYLDAQIAEELVVYIRTNGKSFATKNTIAQQRAEEFVKHTDS